MSDYIIEAGNNTYLSEFMEDMPDNCFLYKTLTGCGATTLALTNSVPYIICVPYISIIQSKTYSVPNTIGFYGDVTDKQLLEYLEQVKIPKIIVTYDSLVRLMQLIDPIDYALLIDECHLLTAAGSFRRHAVQSIVENYQSFNKYCFLTATPIKDKYLIPALKDIPKYTINWNNIAPVKIQYRKIENSIDDSICLIILDYLDGGSEENPHFFINSVDSITRILKKLFKQNPELKNPDTFKIICGNNPKNSNNIEVSLGKKFEIDSVITPSKKITFLTATAFEGCDIFCEEAITYIVTDGTKNSTKYDILTTIPQIINRVRNSKYKNNIYLLYTESTYLSYTSIEEFEIEVNNQLEKAYRVAEDFNKNSDETRETLISGADENAYLMTTHDKKLEPNVYMWHSEMHNYEAIHTTWSVKLKNQDIHQVPYQFTNLEKIIEIDPINKIRLGKVPNFQEICKLYCKAREENDVFKIKLIEKDHHLIKEGYDVLGSAKLKALNYQKGNIKQELLLISTLPADSKIVSLLKLKPGDTLTRAEAKERIGNVYRQLNLKVNPKATDLKQWYSIKEFTSRVKSIAVGLIKIITVNIK